MKKKKLSMIIIGLLIMSSMFLIPLNTLSADDTLSTTTLNISRLPADNIAVENIEAKIHSEIGHMVPGDVFNSSLIIHNDTNQTYKINNESPLMLFVYAAKDGETPEDMQTVYEQWFQLAFEFPQLGKSVPLTPVASFDDPSYLDNNSLISNLTLTEDPYYIMPGENFTINWQFYFSWDSDMRTMSMDYALVIGLELLESPTTGDIILHHVDEEYNHLVNESIVTGNLGDPYSFESLDIEGYELIETPANATGSFTIEPQTVAFVYRKSVPPDLISPEQPPEKQSQQTKTYKILPKSGAGMLGIGIFAIESIGFAYLINSFRKRK